MYSRVKRHFGRLLAVALITGLIPLYWAVPAVTAAATAPKMDDSIPVVESHETGLDLGSDAGEFLRTPAVETPDDPETRFTGRMKGAHTIRIAPQSAGGYGVRLKSGNQIRFLPVGGTNVPGTRERGYQVRYAGVWENTDILLSLGADRLKEEIVLQQPGSVYQWKFRVLAAGLELRTDAETGQVMIGETGESDPVLRLGDLVATDADGNQVPVSLNLSENGREISLSVDKAWLSDPSRRYPVIVDPTVVLVDSYLGGGKIFELGDGTLILVGGGKWRVSKDGGATWLKPQNDTFSPTTARIWGSSLDITADGVVHFVVDSERTTSCSYSNNEEIMYWRGVLSADRLSLSWTTNRQLNSVCSDYYFYQGVDIAAFDAGATTWSHVVWARVYATGTMPFYMEYKRVGVTDSTGAVSSLASTATPLATVYSHDAGTLQVAADKGLGHAIAIFDGSKNSSDSGYLWMNLYYSPVRWSGSAYSGPSSNAPSSWCTTTTSPEVYCVAGGSYNIFLNNSSNGRFQLFSGDLYNSIEVTVTATSATKRAIQPNELILDGKNRWGTFAGDNAGNVWVLWADGSGTLRKRIWNTSTNTWEPDIIVQSPAPGGAKSLSARQGPSFDYVDVTWGNPLYFARMYYNPPSVSGLQPSAGGWVTSVTPTLSWVFSDPNPGDTQSAYQVVIRNSAGTVVQDSGRVNSTVSSYTVPSSKLVTAGSYKWQVTVWDNVGYSYTSAEAPFGVDTTLPTGSLNVNRNGSTTNTTSVYLTLSAADTGSGLKDMRLSSDGTNWSAWETVVADKWYTMSAGNGTRTVSVQYRDVAGNVTTASDSIVLDTTQPTARVTANNGADVTPNSAVTLAVNAVNNPTQMRFKNEADLGWSAWEPFAVSKSWALTEGYGNRTVSVEVSDLNGTVAAASDSIQLALEAPTNLRAWGEPDDIYLQWNASSTTATTGYNVYRTTTAGSGYEKLTAAPLTTLDYRDYTTVMGTRYYYVVRSVNRLGQESPLASNEVSAVSGAYPVGSLGVTEGSTSGPGGQLSLAVRSETAVQWSGIEWRQQGTTAWNLQGGSGTVTPGVPFTVSWQVQETPAPYELRVKLVDDQARVGQTAILLLTLPAPPTAPSALTGSLGNVLVQWSGDGVTYDLERSADAAFSTPELVVGGTTTGSLDMAFNGVANPSFEVPGANGGASRWTAMGQGTYSLDPLTSDAGKVSLRINSSASGEINGVQQRVFQGPGLSLKPVTASARVKLESVNGTGVALRLRFLDRAGKEIATVSSSPVAGTSAWQTLRLTAWAPLNTYRVYLESTLNATGTAWVDSVQVYPELSIRGQFLPGLNHTKAYYRVRAWNGPLFNLSVPVWRTVSPFPSDLGLWAWEY